MTINLSTKPFDQAAQRLPEFMQQVLARVPEEQRCSATEIRMRAGGAVTLTLPEGPIFLTPSGRTAQLRREDCMTLNGEHLAQILRSLCDYSVHSYTEDISRGYLTLPGGHRAGICGTAVVDQGSVSAVRDISSVNLRIAREIPGAAAALCARLYTGDDLPGVLIAGAPGSGKTTLLRDLALRLSNGLCGPCRRVALVDERSELAGVRGGVPCCNVGANTDVLTGYPKGEGILLSLRSLSPEVIICDELGGPEDAEAIEAALHTGVRFAATVHAGSLDEAQRRPMVQRLLRSGAFDRLVQLDSAARPCAIREIRAVKEIRETVC